MSKVFFTSDLHLGHRFVAGLRGFEPEDVASHDEMIRDNWLSVVGKDDIVWVLGDLTVSKRDSQYALDIIKALPGRKRFISGNHDPVHPMHRDAWKFMAQYSEVFEIVQPFARIKVGGEQVLLSHFPYEFDHTSDARYTQWRLRDEGMFLLHGHTHSDVRLTSAKELHVGLDAWDYQLVPHAAVEGFLAGTLSE